MNHMRTCAMALSLVMNTPALADTKPSESTTTRVKPAADPTMPNWYGLKKITSSSSAGAARLDSIIWATDRRLAIINGQIKREGDRVGSQTITQILADRVVLRAASGKVKSLRLAKKNNKKKVQR